MAGQTAESVSAEQLPTGSAGTCSPSAAGDAPPGPGEEERAEPVTMEMGDASSGAAGFTDSELSVSLICLMGLLSSSDPVSEREEGEVESDGAEDPGGGGQQD